MKRSFRIFISLLLAIVFSADTTLAGAQTFALLGAGLYLSILAFNSSIPFMTVTRPFSSLAPASASPSSLG